MSTPAMMIFQFFNRHGQPIASEHTVVLDPDRLDSLRFRELVNGSLIELRVVFDPPLVPSDPLPEQSC